MSAEHKLSYGLFVITVNDGKKDGGCICNTVGQVTTTPNRLAITLNKSNYTTEVLKETGILNVSIISEEASFDLFKRFGFASGRDTDKFENYNGFDRSKNGVTYITDGTNAFLSAKVVDSMDLGSHILFIAEVEESKDLSDAPSATYAFYHSNIKPRPKEKASEKTIWRCNICSYEYEGETLPENFICPWCKHGVEAFEKV